jgi:phosphatidylserine decarboxylase
MIHKEGYPYVLAPALLGGLLFGSGKKRLGLACLSLSMLNAFFFRNPDRQGILNPDYLLSPADGKVVKVDVEKRPEWLDEPLYRVGIFMRLWDVHVNRSPVQGRVINTIYLKGEKKPVFSDSAFQRNEKQVYLIERDDGVPVWVVQVAGLVARRVKSFVLPGDELVAGDIIGLIKFSSRVEVFFPADNAEILVKEGHKVFAGETPIARLPQRR